MSAPTAPALLIHAGEPLAPHDLWTAWNAEPGVVASLLLLGGAYAVGIRRLWAHAGRGRGVRPVQAWSFAAGILALVVALISPLDALGGALFAGHMAQHLVLVQLAAPLVLLGAPQVALAWTLPAAPRLAVARWWRRRLLLRRLAHALVAIPVAWLAHAVALWAWHFPPLYDRAVYDDGVHALEHASFFLTALMFWWAIVRAWERRHTGAGGAAAGVFSLFTTVLHTGLLAAVLTFASRPLYLSHAGRTAPWGLTLLEDQELAGLIMWVPGGLPYLVAALALLAGRMLRPSPASSPG
jgi:putative membrane protein